MIACSSNSENDVDRRKCEQFRDHVLDVQLAGIDKTTDSHGGTVDVDAHRAAMKQALGEDFVATCQKKLTAAQLKCALAATDSAAVSGCASSTK